MRIFLAEPQTNIRYGITVLLDEHPDLDLIGHTQDAHKLFIKLQKLNPDLLLLSAPLPGAPLSVIIDRINLDFPNLRVIVLSSQAGYRQTALAVGADGFVNKAHSPELLLRLIRQLQPAQEPASPPKQPKISYPSDMQIH